MIDFFKGKAFLVFIVSLTVLNTNIVTAKQLTADGFSYSIEEKGAWVVDVAIPKDKPSDIQSVNYLLNNEQLDLTDDKYHYFLHNALEVTSEGGLEHASKFSFSFQPDYQSITLHGVSIIRDGVSIDITDNVDIQLMRREQEFSQNIYNGYVDLVAVVPDMRVGDIIEYSATIKGKNPVLGTKNFAKFAAGWYVPVVENYIRVLTDTDRALYTKLHNVEGEINKSVSGEHTEYLWTQKDIQAVQDEQDYPVLHNPFPYIEFSEYKNWAEVVDWAKALYSDDYKSSQELEQYVSDLKQTAKSKTEYIEKSIQFVQNEVRYFGIAIGENSHMPSSPDLVFSRRYGDCKDKTMLLNFMLSKVGVKAYPALVSNYDAGAIVKHLPSPASFNHVITHFELENKPYWIDGTRNFQYGDLDKIGISNFQKALLIKPDEQSLTDVVLQEEHQSSIRVSEHFKSGDGYDKPVSMSLEVVMGSHEAEYLRASVANQSLRELALNYLNFYGQHFPSIKQVGEMRFTDDKQNNLVTLHADYEIQSYWDLKKPQVYTDFFGEFITSYVQLPTTIARKSPLAVFHPIKIEHKTLFEFPEDINWSLDYTPLEIKDSAVSYVRTIRKDKKLLETVHEYQSLDDTVLLADVPQHITNLKDIKTALYLTVYSDNTQKKSNVKSVLRSLLKKKKAEE